MNRALCGSGPQIVSSLSVANSQLDSLQPNNQRRAFAISDLKHGTVFLIIGNPGFSINVFCQSRFVAVDVSSGNEDLSLPVEFSVTYLGLS